MMYRLRFARSLLLLLLALAVRVRTYNVDDQARTVLTSGLSASANTEENFGFSMAHHRYSDGSQALFVGAPWGNYTDPDYGNLRTGKVYKCEITNGSSCQPEPVFNSKENLVDGSPLDTANFSLDGQLLGFSVHSFGESGILACAPLYLDKINSFPPEISGRCVGFEQDFDMTSVPVQYITSLYDSPPQLLGIDAVFSNWTMSGASVFIGAVLGDTTGAAYGIPFPVTINSEGSRETLADETSEAYFGYHLENARFSNMEGNVLTSGPTAFGHYGQLLPLLYVVSSNQVQQAIIQNGILVGPEDQPDSYFGYDFAVLQLDKNSYDSIAVGCPLCLEDKGQVYIYVHHGDQPADNEPWMNYATKVVIDSPAGSPKGRFGSQVENIGDIDRDGFDDLAVSAPYVGDGVVYIYRGTQDGLSMSQTILPRTVMQGFGYVLAGNFDVDGNNYTDFAVGGFPGDSSGSVEIMRSSPVINIIPSFNEGSETTTYSCVTQNSRLLCFNVTPCFTFSAVEANVSQFAFNYTLEVDEELNRVSLIDNFQTSTIKKQLVATESFFCDEMITYVLSADFARTQSIPISLAVSDADNPLALKSPQDNQFGGSLTPILNQYIAGNIQQNLTVSLEVSLNRSCGDDDICEPEFSMDVEHNISVVYLALRFQLSFKVTLNNSGEDSFASFLGITVTKGITFASYVSDPAYAIVGCSMTSTNTSSSDTSYIRCRLQNPFESGTQVAATINLKPDLNEVSLNTSRVEVNFTVGDIDHVHASQLVTLDATSIAGYNLNTGFGDNIVQASRSLSTPDLATTPVTELGILVAYTITLSNTLNSSVGSPVPRTVATITWPTAIRRDGGGLQPLLIVVEETSMSATCRQQNLYPYELLDTPAFANFSETVPTNCPSNLTCGILQCTFFDLSATSVDPRSPTPPLNILIKAVLYSVAVRGFQNVPVPVHVSVSSGTEYPLIEQEIVTSTAILTVTQAVTEFRESPCSLVPYIITICVSAAFGLVIIVILLIGMGGKTGRYYFEHRDEKKLLELKQTARDDVDGSFNNPRGIRTIPPPGAINIGTELTTEKEVMSKAEEADLEDVVHSKHLEAVLDPGSDGAGETEL